MSIMKTNDIVKFRKDILGITQEQFAKLIEVTPKSISRWERGESEPSRSVLSKIDGLAEILEDEEKKKEILPLIKIATTATTGSVLSIILAGLMTPAVGAAVGGVVGLTKLISKLTEGNEGS